MREFGIRLAVGATPSVALRPETADLAATLLLGMVRGLVIRSIVLGKGEGIVVEVDRLFDAFLRGLGEAGA